MRGLEGAEGWAGLWAQHGLWGGYVVRCTKRGFDETLRARRALHTYIDPTRPISATRHPGVHMQHGTQQSHPGCPSHQYLCSITAASSPISNHHPATIVQSDQQSICWLLASINKSPHMLIIIIILIHHIHRPCGGSLASTGLFAPRLASQH